MLDHRNRTRSGHILTIEDPLDSIHKNRRSLVCQREVGIDTHTPLRMPSKTRYARRPMSFQSATFAIATL